MADIKWSAFPSQGTISTGDTIVGLHAGANVRLDPFSFGQDITVNAITVGQGNFTDGFNSNMAVGNAALGNNVSGTNNVALGYASMQGILTGINNIGLGVLTGLTNDGSNNVLMGFSSGQFLGITSAGSNNTLIGAGAANGGGNISGQDMLGGNDNTWLGDYVTGSASVISGTIGIGKWATPDPTTGSGIGNVGPGIAIGAASFPVGFRGDGSAFPAGSAHYWRMKINDTYYKLPILPDATTIAWPASGTLATTSDISSSAVLLTPVSSQIITTGNLSVSHGNIIAGSSGQAGNLVTFPATAALGSLSLTAANSAGNYSNVLTNASTTAARTWTLPDATGTIALTSQLPSTGSPLAALSGGTGVSNSFNLTVTAASTINQNVSTGATPAFVSISTAPAASSSSSLAVGSAYQNTSGYDVVLTIYLAISAATSASILLGVGPTSTPTQQTIISGLTLAALGVVPVNIYLPNNYYALLSTSGTITQTISGQLTMAV